jgi:hypothetical protein
MHNELNNYDENLDAILKSIGNMEQTFERSLRDLYSMTENRRLLDEKNAQQESKTVKEIKTTGKRNMSFSRLKIKLKNLFIESINNRHTIWMIPGLQQGE